MSELSETLDDAREAGGKPSGLSRATLGLAGGVLLVAGFLGGYVVKDVTQGEQGPDRGMMVGPGGPGGPGMGPKGGPANVTIGTVKSVDGNTVTLTTTDGDTAKVTVDSDAHVMVTKEGSAKDLAKGDQLIVHGQRDGDTIDADMVAKGRLDRGDGPRGGVGG